ncbi:SGNH/GDSL hydrolase family protein [Nocardioides sp.]|uniref:SGNH/GDSL hydrolase family protein n=1 Tax=Nocardioides sp. TaxID=35761 RepID=UPI000C9136C6|nr:SGNH/GDSL hydrolase family protein [Nocardioides sp.]MAS56299.1 hydrolase [Pimelobacter sp.]MDE0778111.1 SGNH/GDSL hydrolase family protein [Nocardioides sp.]
MTRYVALGSSMAAGPGLLPRAPGSPAAAMRSARNYPSLLAADLGHELVDVSYSGATTAHLLHTRQNSAAPQLDALDGTESLVTITIGGNDIAYVPGMYVATLPRATRALPIVGPRLRDALDPHARELALARLAPAMRAVGREARSRSPRARVVFVDYLTLLPPAGERSFPLRRPHADLARHLAVRLEEITAEAAEASGCELVSVATASREHHAWSADPWTVGLTLPTPGTPLAYHPNESGMRAVAELVAEHL